MTPAIRRIDTGIARLAGAPAAVQRLILALFAAMAFLPALATLPVTDRDEARFVQASRQMIASGDPIDIRFQDEPRYKKPVGIYWLQALAMLAEGRGATAPLWASRLPSYLAAIAAVVLVQAAGLPLIGAGPAFLASLLFAGTLVLAGEARIAKTDAVLLALVLGMMAVLARLYIRRSLPEGQVYAFWICLALAALVKGPVGPMIVGLAVLALSLADRDRRWLAPLGHRRAIGVLVLILVPWIVAITNRAGADFWIASVGTDLLRKVAEGQEGKGAPPGTYLVLVWFTFWPGSALLAPMLPAIAAARRAPPQRFLLAWLLPGWAVFEAVPTKLIHYPLPLYPALALLAVAAWTARPPGALRPPARFVMLALLALGPVVLGAGIWLAAATGAGRAAWPALAALPPVLFLGLACQRGVAADLRHTPVAALALMAALTAAGVLATLARVPYLWPSAALAPLMQAPVPGCPAPRLLATGYSEPSLIVLTGRATKLLDPGAAAASAARGCAMIAVDDRAAAAFARAAGDLPRTETGRVEGFAIGAGRTVGLDVFAVGPRP